MHDVVLHFSSESVAGGGVDVIGAFTFAGHVRSDGSVTMVKQYFGGHRVLYHGQYDGEGTIHGQWSIDPHWSGPFLLHMDRTAMAEPSHAAGQVEPR